MVDNRQKTELDANLVLQAEGLRCPEPIMMIRKSMRSLSAGDVLLVIADDPASKRDVANFCEHMDHQILEAQTETAPFKFWLKKGAS